jgi:hypothetical protein
MSDALIFISYSRQDEEWMKLLVKHLRVLQRDDSFRVWTDQEIGVGEDWLNKIREALNNARVGILLVSADSLTSNCILNEELPPLLKKRAKDGLRFIPIIIRYCGWQALDWLKQMNVRPKGAEPLSKRGARAEKEFAQIALELTELFKPPPASETTSAGSTVEAKTPGRAPRPESSPKTDEKEQQGLEEKAARDPAFAQRLRDLGAKYMTTGQPTGALASDYQEDPLKASASVSEKTTKDEPEF